MFKSIEYKLYFNIILLIITVIASTYFATQTEYVYMSLSTIIVLIALHRLRSNYNQFNKNILFLLNALENNDFTFNFRETKLSRRERELNRMLNRIKGILSKARMEVIENEKFLSVIMESVSTGIIIQDNYNMVVQVNSAVNKLLGLPVFTHIKQLGNIDKSLPDIFLNLKEGDSKTIKFANEREDVQLIIRASEITIKGKNLKIITIANIGSELDYIEMDSWIKLIRVLTHEIMNSIAPITSLTDTLLTAYNNESSDNLIHSQETDLAEKDVLLRENTIEALQTINTTAKGLINFVRTYREFTVIPKPQMKSVSVQSLINRGIKLNATYFEEKQISIT